jgi:mono/diheme cytochrome c family protein
MRHRMIMLGALLASFIATTAVVAQPPHGMGGMRDGHGGRQSVALGDSIFHGTAAGGTCFTCHGAQAKGTALAPDLTDSLWLNGDGSFPFIMRTVMHGVPKPTRYPAPMPPMGGARLTMLQARAVADYVYRLGHPAP